MYMLAMLLWRANNYAEADLKAKKLLTEVADDDPALDVWNDRGVSLPHKHAFDMLWMAVWPNFHKPAPVPGPVPCADHHQCASPS